MNPFLRLSWPRPGHRLAAVGLALGLLLIGSAAQAQTTLYNAAGTDLSVFGDMYNLGTFENAGNFVPGAGRLILAGGDLLVGSTGTIGAGTGTVELDDASAARTITLRNETLPNLALNVPLGTTLSTDARISSSLTLTSGHLLTTAANKLYLSPTAVLNGETNAHYVKGFVQQTQALSGTGAVDFGQMGFTINPAGQSFPLTVERRAGLSLPGVSYGQNPNQAPYKGIDRMWALSGTSTVSTPVTLVLSWLPDNDNGLSFSGSNAQAWRSDDNGATWIKQNDIANGSSRSLTITTTHLNSLYTVSTLASPLPVELISFAGTLVVDDGQLTWRTASEKNSAYFALEESNDGRTNWQVLTKVPAAGNTATPQNYSYTDLRISRYGVPVVYYRLRQVDLDAKASYSPVITLRPTPPAGFTLEVWPNPTATDAQVRVVAAGTEPIDVTVYDVTGRVIYRSTVAPNTVLPLQSKEWATGAYAVRAHQGTHTITRLLVRE